MITLFLNTIAKVSTRDHRRPVCSRSSRNEIARPHIFVPRNLISRNSRQRKYRAPPRSKRERVRKIFGISQYRLYYAAKLNATHAYICFDEPRMNRDMIPRWLFSIRRGFLFSSVTREFQSSNFRDLKEGTVGRRREIRSFQVEREEVASLLLTSSYTHTSTYFSPRRLPSEANDDYL